MPDPEKLLVTLRRATELHRATPGRTGGLISLEHATEVMVVGDLHGHIPAFRKVLDYASLAQNPGRHLILQELIHGRRLYPDDGGDKSHQLVDLVAALKCQYKDRVHVILGNHELSEITGRVIGKDGYALNALFRQGINTAYGDRANDVYEAYQRLFCALPLAIRTPNRVFICHTIPDAMYLDTLNLGVFELDDWPAEEMKRGGSVYALTWGRDTSPETVDRFAAMVDADYFITGHQPCEHGFRQANHRQIIVDGTDPSPSFLMFPAKSEVTMESLLAGGRVMSLL